MTDLTPLQHGGAAYLNYFAALNKVPADVMTAIVFAVALFEGKSHDEAVVIRDEYQDWVNANAH